MRARHWLFVAALAIVTAWSLRARAATEKRQVPDYDGRGAPPASVGDTLIWAPRVLASPLYLVSEYALRRPLGALVVTAERDNWPRAIVDFFTFDAEHKAGIFPTAFVDFGFRPSAGLYFFWDDALARKNAIRLHAATWGVDWLTATVADRYALGDDATVALRCEATRRSDFVFHGIGPRSLQSDLTRYSADRLEGSAVFDTAPLPSLRLGSSVGVRRTRFREGSCCAGPSLLDRIQEGAVAPPPGLEGYDLGFSRMDLSIDSRLEKGHSSGTGVRLELQGEGAFRLDNTPPSSFVGYGGSIGGFVDLTGTRRVLSLSLAASFVDPLLGSEIPFPELVHLGGSGPMRGYRDGRLLGRSAAVATLQYEWPIWVWLDGSIQVAAGNVFGAHLSDFDPRLARLSGTVGIRTSGSPDHRFEILTGFGTETWEDGLKVTSFRLMIGATRGF
jgi:hypothetical protein